MKEIDHIVASQCETLVTCNICKDKFFSIDDSGKPKIPKVLECQHSFCDICLKGYISSGSLLTSVFPCPTCRRSNLWPLKGIDGFPTDRKAKLILDLMENLKEAPCGAGEGPVCKVCSENKMNKKGDFFCLSSMQMLCKECFSGHRSSEVLSHHKFIDMASGKIIQDNPSNVPLCKQHQQLLFYTCTTCDKELCQLCLFSHMNHQFIVIRSDSHDSGDLTKLQEDIDLAKQQLENATTAEKALDKDLEAAKEAVEQNYKKARSELEQRRTALLQEIKDRKGGLNKLTLYKKKIQLKVKEAEKVLERSDKKRDKGEEQVRVLMENLHEEAPMVKRLLFQGEVEMKIGSLVEREEALEENSHLSTSCQSISSSLSTEASGKSSVSTERLKDAVIETLKVSTIMRMDHGQSSRMVESVKASERSLWKVPARCKSCSFACKGRGLVMLDASEREVAKQLKLLRSSDGKQTKVNFELGEELINHLIDLKVEKNSLFLLCSTTSQHTLLKKFKLDLTTKQLGYNVKESLVKCYETNNLDTLEATIIHPIGFALKKNHIAILANKGCSLHLFSTKFKPLTKLTSGEFGKSNFVDLDDKGNLYVSDIARGEIRVFDRAGQIKSNFSYMGQGGLPMAPQGIRVDDKGCILVADQAIGAVSIYDTNNRLLNHVAENIASPVALAYSSDRHVIAVASHDSVHLYEI